MKLYENRRYRPVASLDAAAPVDFEVSGTFVQIEFKNPAVRLRVPLKNLRFTDDTYGLQRLPVVKLTAGADLFWWETTLTHEDGAELRALVYAFLAE
jgi:hypothetical protein